MEGDTTRGLGDPELEERARGGDASARSELQSRAREPLIAFCYRYLGNVHEAEDVAQDVMTALAAKVWPAGSFRAWVFRVARNRCLNVLKRRRDGRAGAGSCLGTSRMASSRTGPGTALAREEERELLRQHLAALPRKHAEVLMLRYFDELGRKEIAEVLELSESVVKSRLFEAIRELRKRTKGDS